MSKKLYAIRWNGKFITLRNGKGLKSVFHSMAGAKASFNRFACRRFGRRSFGCDNPIDRISTLGKLEFVEIDVNN